MIVNKIIPTAYNLKNVCFFMLKMKLTSFLILKSNFNGLENVDTV